MKSLVEFAWDRSAGTFHHRYDRSHERQRLRARIRGGVKISQSVRSDSKERAFDERDAPVLMPLFIRTVIKMG